jgi:hypothetical protein
LYEYAPRKTGELNDGVRWIATHVRNNRAVLFNCDEAAIRTVTGKGANAMTFTGAKVFTATKAKDREELGEVLTRWLRDNPRLRIIDKIVTQSSDNEFHCLSITVFYDLAAA